MRTPKILFTIILILVIFNPSNLFAQALGNLDEWDISPFRPYGMLVTPDGSPWLSYIDVADPEAGKICTIDPMDGSVTEFEAPFASRFHSMDLAPVDNLWLADDYHRIVHFDKESGSFTPYAMPSDIYDRSDPEAFMGLSTAPDGKVWFSLWSNKTINFFDPITSLWEQFSIPNDNGFMPGVPVEIDFDRNGNVWFTMRVWETGKAGIGYLDVSTSEFTL